VPADPPLPVGTALAAGGVWLAWVVLGVVGFSVGSAGGWSLEARRSRRAGGAAAAATTAGSRSRTPAGASGAHASTPLRRR
jgi:hypothetical protein